MMKKINWENLGFSVVPTATVASGAVLMYDGAKRVFGKDSSLGQRFLGIAEVTVGTPAVIVGSLYSFVGTGTGTCSKRKRKGR